MENASLEGVFAQPQRPWQTPFAVVSRRAGKHFIQLIDLARHRFHEQSRIENGIMQSRVDQRETWQGNHLARSRSSAEALHRAVQVAGHGWGLPRQAADYTR